jgi:opacity protein-like surface antigen
VLGLEGDFDYFHSNPNFSNNTNTLSDGTTPFTIAQSLTTDFLATVRPRIGVAADRNLAYITGGAAFTRVSYTESYVDGAAPPVASTLGPLHPRPPDMTPRRRSGLCRGRGPKLPAVGRPSA